MICAHCQLDADDVETRYDRGARPLCEACCARVAPTPTGGPHPELPGVQLAPGGPRCWECEAPDVSWRADRDAWLCEACG
jgi:hypothetical protein